MVRDPRGNIIEVLYPRGGQFDVSGPNGENLGFAKHVGTMLVFYDEEGRRTSTARRQLLPPDYPITAIALVRDRDLQLSRLVGSNRRFAMQHLPHLSGLLVADLDDALEGSDIMVIGTPHASFRGLAGRLRSDHEAADLAGHDEALRQHPAYEGVCW